MIDAIPSHAIDGERGGQRWSILAERFPRASLIPLNDSEDLQPRSKSGIAPWTRGIAGTAVQEQEHGVVTIFSANGDPLLDSAKHHVAAVS
jgi:hypothetical protein